MSLEEIKEVLAEISQGIKANEVKWLLTGNTRHEINWATKDVIIDRRNNIDKNSQEICLKVGEYEGVFYQKQMNSISYQNFKTISNGGIN